MDVTSIMQETMVNMVKKIAKFKEEQLFKELEKYGVNSDNIMEYANSGRLVILDCNKSKIFELKNIWDSYYITLDEEHILSIYFVCELKTDEENHSYSYEIKMIKTYDKLLGGGLE